MTDDIAFEVPEIPSGFQGAVRKFHRCETTKNRIQNRKNAVLGFIEAFKLAANSRGPGRKANITKSMLSSQPIGCHTLPQGDLR